MSSRPLLLLSVALAGLAVFPVVGTSAGAAPVARVDQIGWWSQAQPATSGLGLPTRVTLPPPPTTPQGSAPVTAVAGQQESVVAVGFATDGPADPALDTISVTIPLGHDATDTNGAAAVIAACPISEAWGPADNGPMSEAPTADCEGAPLGKRGTDGAWHFDLPASTWQHGVLLIEQVDPPVSFQVPFTADTSAVSVTVVSGTPRGEAPAAPPSFNPTPSPNAVSPAPFTGAVSGSDGQGPTLPPSEPSVAAPPMTPATGSSSRHLPDLPASSIVLGLVALVVYALAGLSIGRRLLNPEVNL